MQRRTWSPKEKLMIVLEGLKGNCTVGELCNTHQISQSQYYKWRDQLLADGQKIFATADPTKPNNDSKRKTDGSRASSAN